MHSVSRQTPQIAVSPLRWGETLSTVPILTSETTAWSNGLLRRWRHGAADMLQPPLDHHYIVLHLGGAKRVTRLGDGGAVTAEVPLGGLTIVPAGSAFRWHTEGPIDFAHLYLHPHMLQRLNSEAFSGSRAGLALESRIGVEDMLLQGLFTAMLDEAAGEGARLYLDTLYQAFALRLLRHHAAGPAAALQRPAGLARYRLTRVLDYIEAHLADDIALADLAGIAAMSQAHFSRAFAAATGAPPYAYVLHRRIERAQERLIATTDPVAEIARACGFRSAVQFARIFRQRTKRSPSAFRREA